MNITAEDIRNKLTCGNGRCADRSTRGNTHCPNHDDATPSLSVNEKDGKILVKCFGGCLQEDVIQKLKSMDLWLSSLLF